MFATWRLALLQRLAGSVDPVLAAIAAKGVKEVTYHRDYAAQWAVRLGDGTAESHDRMAPRLTALWPLTAELFAVTEVERRLAEAGVAVDPGDLAGEFAAVIEHGARGGDAAAASAGRRRRTRRPRRRTHGGAATTARRVAEPRPRRSGGDVVSGS